MTSNTKWQLSGKAAELYEDYLVPTIFIPWADHLLTKANVQMGDDILDVACGTGIVARMAKNKVGEDGRIVGVDLNASMLQVAESKSLCTEIEWIESDVGAIPIEDESFDIVICQQGLQFFPDKLGALREIFRLLRPGGRCLVCVAGELEENPLMRSQVAALTKHINEDAAGGIRAVCGLPDGETIRELFLDAGFQNVVWETVTLTLVHHDALAFVTNGIASTPVANLIVDWSHEARTALIADIVGGFGDHYDGEALKFPHVSNVVESRKT